MSYRWQQVLVPPDTPILKAIEVINQSDLQICLVVDDDRRLLGTVTDGDIRRGILKGITLDQEVSAVMNDEPKVTSPGLSRQRLLATMQRERLHHMPVVDESGLLQGLEVMDDLTLPEERDNWVVLMAGGLGSRLRPLTEECPKPLLKVGNKPVLETILESFLGHGFKKFFVALNYKGEMIEEYFGDGDRWGCQIEYLREERPLGTAGALGLLPERPGDPILVMNSDLLTNVHFGQLLSFHQTHGAQATMCLREYDHQIPYGVVRMEEHRLVAIEEKPVQRVFINAGVYVLEPSVLQLIPPNEYFDMTSLFDAVMADGGTAVVFPIREYWLDIGKREDLERAGGEFSSVFE